MTAQDLASLIARHRIPLTAERACQNAIEDVLVGAGIAFERERSLGGLGRIDFLVGRIGIEVKVSGISSPREIYRQMVRYCRAPELDTLILATGRSVSLPVMPKPVTVLSLGRAWL